MPPLAMAQCVSGLAKPLLYYSLPSIHETLTVTFGYKSNKILFGRRSPGSLKVSSKGPTPISFDHSYQNIFVGLTPTRRGSSTRAQARTDRTSGVSHHSAKSDDKPEWWLRTLAAASYLIACQFSDVGYYILPILEHHETFEDLFFFIPGGAKRWFSWLPMIYCFAAYTYVVKNKRWPHFLRFHLIMAMLLETALQVVWVASNWAPMIHFNGSLGMYYWALVGFLYIGILLNGVRCALRGEYSNVPFVGIAALIHTEYNVGGFHRPF